MNIFTYLFRIGIRAEQPEYIQEKIRIGNSIALLGLFFSVPYIFISSAFYPSLLSYYIISSIAYVSILGLNAFGFYNLSRLLDCIFVSVSTAVLYIAFHSVGQPPITGLAVLAVSTIVLPWLLFDLAEWRSLGFALLIHLLCLISMRIGTHWIEADIDSAFMREPVQEIQYILASAFILCACIFFLKNSHLRTKKNNDKLVEKMQQQQSVLQEKETKLSTYVAEVEESQRVNLQRQWTSDGLAMFAEILRRESHDTGKLYDTLIAQIVRYVKANQGGLFLVQNENAQEMYIELAACYAYERKKYQKKRIEVGEGMVGQAVQEMDTLYLTDVPGDYVHITSGLGKANPTSLLIIPLQVNDHVEGVLELASFNNFEPYQVEFLQKLGESIAATIAAARTNQRTKQLLDASQWQTEALRAQEEEMRQNMEELAATQEEMERKTREMEELYAQSREREKELMNSLAMLENTRKETDTKQQEIQTLLYEAQRNEEQLRNQEEMLRNTLAQIQAAQNELQVKNEEIEKTKQDEKARATAQIEAQKKIMQKVMDKQKTKEQEMQQKLEALQLQLDEYRRKP